MIKIITTADLENLQNAPKVIKKYISELLDNLLSEYYEYCADCSISAIGAIFFMEDLQDFDNHADLGLPLPLEHERIEWITAFEDYCVICYVIDNDRAINLVCCKELYNQWTKTIGGNKNVR